MLNQEEDVPKPTKEELWQHLLEQMEFLRTSAQSFDQGRLSEAKRLASTTRTLIHSTDRSVSLLKQLKLLPGMAFWSTTRNPKVQPHIAEMDSGSHLLELEFTEKGLRYYAPGAVSEHRPDLRVPRLLFFPAWWNETVVTTKTGSIFSRREIVMALANKLGGSHVETQLPAALSDLVTNATGLHYRMGSNAEFCPVLDIELHTMRQIAHEVLISIDRKLRV